MDLGEIEFGGVLPANEDGKVIQPRLYATEPVSRFHLNEFGIGRVSCTRGDVWNMKKDDAEMVHIDTSTL